MRPAKVSKLDRFRDLLFRLWERGETIAEIRRVLAGEGCQARDTTISKWFIWRVEEGEIPARGPAPPPNRSPEDEPRSLGMFEGVDSEDWRLETGRILRILFEKDGGWTAEARRWALGQDGFNMPLGPDCEPDLERYAESLGWRRLKTLGDMDFVLLTLWTPNGRRICTEEPHRRIRKLLQAAGETRRKMFLAVGLRPPP